MKNISLLCLLSNSVPYVLSETLQESMRKTQEDFQKFLQHPFWIIVFLIFCFLALWQISCFLRFLFSRLFPKKNVSAAVWTGWDILFFTFFYFSCFIILSSIMAYFLPFFSKDKEYFFRLLVYWTVHIVSLVFLFFFLSFLPGYDKKSLGICPLGHQDVLGAVLGYVCFFPWYLFLFYFSHLCCALFHLEPKVQDVAQELMQSQGISWWFSVITVILLAPAVEEVIFRAFIFCAMKKYLGVVGGTILTSVVFSIMHQNLLAFFPILGLGIFLQILYEKSQCLWACIIAHSLHNALTLVYLLL
ncbi:MAG: CPBP family intramembrane metalloprotease [Candidatus Brocadiae bacterium]|nr:CPBP family intramembrane metalloprotease [Candidatus Brocadiia bacterium]